MTDFLITDPTVVPFVALAGLLLATCAGALAWVLDHRSWLNPGGEPSRDLRRRTIELEAEL